jgi:hypothetical protein
MEAIRSSETFVHRRTAWICIPEDGNIQDMSKARFRLRSSSEILPFMCFDYSVRAVVHVYPFRYHLSLFAALTVSCEAY